MRLELAERLICPAAHDTTPLIVVALETVGRDLRRAELGCMRCHRSASIRDGSVDLGYSSMAVANSQPHAPSEELLFRLEALLGLSEPDVPVLLGGRYQYAAAPLAARTDAVIAVHQAWGASPAGVGFVSLPEDRLPFADGTFAAAALDDWTSTATNADIVRVVRRGGRIIGEDRVMVPDGVRELARDAYGWVGEVEAPPSRIIPLRRA